MRNETEFINLIKAPLEDKNFPKKFVIATLATLGSVLLLPGLPPLDRRCIPQPRSAPLCARS